MAIDDPIVETTELSSGDAAIVAAPESDDAHAYEHYEQSVKRSDRSKEPTPLVVPAFTPETPWDQRVTGKADILLNSTGEPNFAQSDTGVWAMYNADCVPFTSKLPSNSIDFTLYSPPFGNLYVYSAHAADMGNVANDDEFIEAYMFLVHELHRVMRPGRLVTVHCKDLVNYENRDGMAGLRDFSGALIEAHRKAGFSYHSRITIWKDPVIEMQRTKAHGLLYKSLRGDSSRSRVGLPEYLLLFRKWPESKDDPNIVPVTHTYDSFPLLRWQEWASPIWKSTATEFDEAQIEKLLEWHAPPDWKPGASEEEQLKQLLTWHGPIWPDINQTNVLNVRQARDDRDEKHICPLQLDVCERAIKLWSNPGEVVYSPFGGIGSEPYTAVLHGRKGLACELKEKYWEHAVKNLGIAEQEARGIQGKLFDDEAKT